MALDAAVLAQIREHVGSTPDDPTVEAAYARFSGETAVEQTALSILRTRYADLVAAPAQFDVQGDYSQNTGKNLDALAAKIADLEAVCGTGAGTLTTAVLTRATGR